MRITALLLCALASLPAAIETIPLTWRHEGTTMAGFLVYPDDAPGPLPGLVMVPNWMGVSDNATAKAATIAALGYVVLVADVYGAEVRPTTSEEARAAAASLRSNRPLLRARTAEAVAVLRAQDDRSPLDPTRIAAIGFCFGGGSVLELARAGTEVAAVVSFHGNLDTPLPAAADTVTAKVLVLHGAADPLVPPEQVAGFIDEMTAAGVDWQLVSYGGAVHSFTNPDAASPGRSQYHPVVARRAFAAMQNLLEECFAGD